MRYRPKRGGAARQRLRAPDIRLTSRGNFHSVILSFIVISSTYDPGGDYGRRLGRYDDRSGSSRRSVIFRILDTIRKIAWSFFTAHLPLAGATRAAYTTYIRML